MTVAAQMLQTCPQDLGGADREKVRACIEACLECAQACTACADVRDATGRVLSRHTGYDADLTSAVLEACAAACKACGDECGGHADMHEHCRVCADACRRCEQACRGLISTQG